MEKDNVMYFRILYVIGIIMVVAGHCYGGGFSIFYEWFNPFSFHLGLFMFGSGYFYYKNIHNKPMDILKHKIKKIILPLYIWNLFYGIVVNVLKSLKIINYGGSLSFTTLFIEPIYSGHSFGLNLASWFLVPLFMIQVFSIFLLPFLKRGKHYGFIFLTYFILGVFGIYMSIKGYNTEWLLVITRFLYFLPFFGLGILYRGRLEKYDTSSNLVYFSVVLLLQLILLYYNGGSKGYTVSWCQGFDNVIVPYLLGFNAIAFWLRVSKILAPILKNSKLIKNISENTFSIMMHHLFGFFLLNSFFAFFSKNFSLFDSFDFKQFSTNIWYSYLPSNLTQFRILYLIFGILFSIMFNLFVKKVWKRIKSYVMTKFPILHLKP